MPDMGMGDPSMMGGDPNAMGMDPNMMDGGPNAMGMYPSMAGGDPNAIGGFDAGVEADENTDPHSYIQQLCGKLSQSLLNYNNDQTEPDTDLNKYVLGMMIPQCIKAMTPEDQQEMANKILNPEEGGDDANADPNAMAQDPNAMGGDPNAMQQDPNAMAQDPNAAAQQQMPMEMVFTKKSLLENARKQMISELFQDLTKSDEDRDNNIATKKQARGGHGYNGKPFMPKRFNK